MRRFFLCFATLLSVSIASADEFPAVQVYEMTSKSVVLILSKFEGKQSIVGAGSLITKRGLILTCAHVVVDKEGGTPALMVEVFVKPDKVTGDFRRDFTKRYKADLVAYDSNLDLAVLKVKDFQDDVEPIAFAGAEEVRIGEDVVAIGHPEQGGFWTLTYGRISGEIENQANVPGRDVYQTDTSVNRGNSGGPLLDRRGFLVGINANIARVGAGNIPITGVNFAVKSVVAGKWLEKTGYPAPHAYSRKGIGESPVVLKDDTPPLPKQDIVPQAGPVREKKNESVGKAEASQPAKEQEQALKEDKILTPRRPYRMDEFLAVVEKDMSEMMEEMRGKMRR